MSDLKLITNKGEDSALQFGLFYPCATTRGTVQLVQEFSAELFSDVLVGFSRGTGLLQNLINLNVADQYSIETATIDAINLTVDRIKARQASQQLKNSERLESAFLREIVALSAGRWQISIDLTTQSGETIEFVI